MKDRFTHTSKHGRGNIPKAVRNEVYKRDSFTCQFCGVRLGPDALTIDHLVPLARGGLDEITNYITSCRACNQRKDQLPLHEFAQLINVHLVELPVHGDPVIDNQDLPLQIRLLRKRIFDKYRQEELRLSGKTAQRKLEKDYRRHFWQTDEGTALESQFPALPGHVRIMIPEIQTIAGSEREFWLLVELAKSANTRNLIGTVLNKDCPDIEERFRSTLAKTRDASLRTRMEQALARFERRVKALKTNCPEQLRDRAKISPKRGDGASG